MGMTAVFIDGAYVEKVVPWDPARTNIDFEKLVGLIVSDGDELLRVHYYHCLPYRSKPPTREENELYNKKQRFFEALGHIPKFTIRLGKLILDRHCDNGKPEYKQKWVDVMIAVDMTLLVAKQRVSKVILFAGDSDFTPAIEAAKAESILTTVWHGGGGHSGADDLLKACDEPRELTAQDVTSIRKIRYKAPGAPSYWSDIE
ncbi:MAG: NYN domain-containing protein [Chloroflexi bacterium]|nr:NYN domain-containing protein [Chloroflexota bacterium]